MNPTREAKNGVLILGDIHARKKHVATVLHRAGVMDIHGRRLPNSPWVIQLGDAVSLGYDEREHEFFQWLCPFVDEWLLGNHELPVFWYNNDLNFKGWSRHVDEKTGEVEFEFGRCTDTFVEVRERGLFVPGGYWAATHVGKWVITHAGIHPYRQKTYRKAEATAEDISGDLNKRLDWCLRNQKKDPMISGMWETDGGIFWLRFHELGQQHEPTSCIPQIVGHTPSGGPVKHKEGLWCLDTKGGCAGLLTFDEGESFELIASLP